MEQYTDQVFVPHVQSQSRTSEEFFTQEIEELIGKTIQALYSFALSHPTNSRDLEKSGFDFWLTQFMRIEQCKTQIVFGALKGGYFTTIRPILELAFGIVDIMKRQHKDLSAFPKAQTQIKNSNNQVYQILGEFSTSSKDQSQLQLDLNRILQQMADSTANAISERWKKAKQDKKEAELIGEWFASGLLILDSSINAMKVISQGAVSIAGKFRKILGSKLPASLEIDLNLAIQRNRAAFTELNVVPSTNSSKYVVNSNLVFSKNVKDSKEILEEQIRLLNVLNNRNFLVYGLERAGFDRAIISLAQKHKAQLKQIRNGYSREVNEIKILGDRMLSRGISPKKVAKIMHEKRRDIGKKYKDFTPDELKPFIFGRNIKEYNDALGPSFKTLVERGLRKGHTRDTIWMRIIETSTMPNTSINTFVDLL